MIPADARPLARITDPILGTLTFWGPASPLEVVIDGCVVASCTTPAAAEAARRLLTSQSPEHQP